VDAEKRTLIKQLPHTLVLHLKRFEWDYETYQRWKVGIPACLHAPCAFSCLCTLHCSPDSRFDWLALAQQDQSSVTCCQLGPAVPCLLAVPWLADPCWPCHLPPALLAPPFRRSRIALSSPCS
jgi:hypothetical protein